VITHNKIINKLFSMKARLMTITATTIMALTACKKDNVAANSRFTFQLKAANPTSTVARTMATVSWQSGFVNTNLIKFEAKQSGNEVEFKSNVQRHIDLFALPTDIGNITVPSGTYDETEFKIFIAPNSGEPAFQLQGTVDATPLIFKIENSNLIKAEQHQVTLSGSNVALTTIDLSGLTQGISAADFTKASQTNGAIVISSSSNANLYNTILNNLSRLGETEVEIHQH
jgi:hypothetical protein